MITIDDIKNYSKIHGPLGGKRTVIEYNDCIISIVGGRERLYGDFNDNFELAVRDKKTNEFITSKYYGSDDVVPYMSAPILVDLLNDIIREDSFRFL